MGLLKWGETSYTNNLDTPFSISSMPAAVQLGPYLVFYWSYPEEGLNGFFQTSSNLGLVPPTKRLQNWRRALVKTNITRGPTFPQTTTIVAPANPIWTTAAAATLEIEETWRESRPKPPSCQRAQWALFFLRRQRRCICILLTSLIDTTPPHGGLKYDSVRDCVNVLEQVRPGEVFIARERQD